MFRVKVQNNLSNINKTILKTLDEVSLANGTEVGENVLVDVKSKLEDWFAEVFQLVISTVDFKNISVEKFVVDGFIVYKFQPINTGNFVVDSTLNQLAKSFESVNDFQFSEDVNRKFRDLVDSVQDIEKEFKTKLDALAYLADSYMNSLDVKVDDKKNEIIVSIGLVGSSKLKELDNLLEFGNRNLPVVSQWDTALLKNKIGFHTTFVRNFADDFKKSLSVNMKNAGVK